MTKTTLLWTPPTEDVEGAALSQFIAFLRAERGIELADHRQLWEWSVDDLPGFWDALVEFFRIPFAQRGPDVLVGESIPDATWFPGSTLNYINRILDHRGQSGPAIIDAREGIDGEVVTTEIGWERLIAETAVLAATLRAGGVGVGDRVVGYIPNSYEGVVAFLATASLGATWASCGLDYAAKAAIDRLAQLEPAALICGDGYQFNGKAIDKSADVTELVANLPAVTTRVWIPRLHPEGQPPSKEWTTWADATAGEVPLEPVAVGFGHPLWVLFSSGTTGIPKGMVHSHGGIVLEHVKNLALQVGLRAGETFWWFTSPSWMMWNLQIGGLLMGATIVCYDGSPTWGGPGAVWRIAGIVDAAVLGTSPGYLANCMKADLNPTHEYDLGALRVIGVTGSPLTETVAGWLQSTVGERIQIASSSGGTDVATSFVGSLPTAPVWAGELSAPGLGVAVAAFDPVGNPVVGEVGELVVTRPMPSMPTQFWNDPDGVLYRDAYFDMYPDVWRHGDWVTLTDRGSFVIHGRSDSTLNRQGVRIGTGEIYDVVEGIPEVREALVLGVEQPGGGYWMPMFVHLLDGVALDEALRARIVEAIRQRLSSRHVPDEIHEAPGIPHTRTGKKLEIPLKRIFQGAAAGTVIDASAVDRSEVLAWFIETAVERHGRLPATT